MLTLDQIVVQLAAKAAIRLMASGQSAAAAATAACPGAWATLRPQVMDQLVPSPATHGAGLSKR